MTAWWIGHAPAQTTVECAGQTHRVAWRAGELVALDHDDAEGERALAALGGQGCACVDLLDAWQRHRADLRVLTLASRGPADILRIGDDAPAGGSLVGGVRPMASLVGWTTGMPAAWIGTPPVVTRRSPRAGRRPPGPADGRRGRDQELIGLLGLGGGLADRLQAGVIASWARRLREPEARGGWLRPAGETEDRLRPELEAALFGRLAAGLRAWLGEAGLELELAVLDAGQAPSLVRTGARRLRAELPFGWLEAVWSRGLSTVMGRLCLDASTADGREWTLLTVGPELGATETMRLRRPGG